MKVLHCYAQGGKHIKLKKPCEDRTYSMHKNGVSVISLADGAGSDKYTYAAQGAECVTKAVAEFFCDNFEKFYDNKDEEKLKNVLISVCIKQLKIFAKENNIDDIREMASTLLCVAVKGERSIVCHLGDGVIGKLTKDGTQVLSLPENGEFANCTYFVTSNEAEKHLRIIKSTNKDVTGYFLMSDGVADYVFDDASQTFYDSARKLTLLVTEEDCEKKLAETLDRFIISVDSNSDDCSFAAIIIEENFCHINADMLNSFVEDTKKTNIALLKKTKKHNTDLRKVIVIASAIVLVTLEPADSKESLEFAKRAFEISEKYDTPVILRMCTRIAHSQSIVETSEREDIPQKEYEKNIGKYVMMPGNAKKRHPFVEERTELLRKEVSESDEFNKVEMGGTDLGIITSGASYQYVKEVFGEEVSVLKIGMVHPLPVEKIKDFASKVKRLVVIEELDGVIETHCKNNGIDVEGKNLFTNIGEYSQKTIAEVFSLEKKESISPDTALPIRPPVMCAGCPHRGMFYTLSQNKVTVSGDIGCYTLGAQLPLGAIDTTLCMGASVSGLHGFNKAMGEKGEKKSVAVIGDSTFMHSGMTGLVNIAYNASNSTVIILDNSITGMTGHQQNPTTGYTIKGDPASKIDLESFCRAIGIRRVRVVDPYNLLECDKAVKEELAAEEPSVIISRRPCVLLKYVKPKKPVVVDTDKCKSCKKCMKLGCPAISMHNKKAHIDETLCVGCGVCEQLCAFDAIKGEE